MAKLGFTARVTLILWPLASIVLSLVEIFVDHGQQWDLTNYLEGLRAFRAGQNPYVDALFIYPPVFLPLLDRLTRPFTHDQLYVGLLAAKTLGLGLLVYLWRRVFVTRLPLHLFLPAVWLGFHATCAIDLYAGNISVFETTLLALAFACFVHERLYATAALVVLAATPKLAPIFFLVALPTRAKGVGPFLAGVAGFAFYLGFNFGAFPTFTRSFVHQAWSRTGESRLINPSALAFVKDAFPAWPSALATTAWLALALTIYFVSWRAWRARRDVPALETILFLILVYVVSAPRMKDYAYMIALPSVLYAMETFRPRRTEWLLALPVVFNTKTSAPALFETPFALVANYYPLVVAAGFWGLYLARFTAPSPALARPSVPGR